MIAQAREVIGVFAEKIKRTSAVESFRFRTKEAIDFLPGQFLEIIFDKNNRSNRALNKYLSFSSAPGKKYIEVTKKISGSEFSRSLTALKPGDETLFKASLGNCVFKDEYKKIGFLIGGIGITPVISILEHITDKKLATDVCLLYSNRAETEIAFKLEIDAWSKNNRNIKVLYTVSDGEARDKKKFSGQINKEFFRAPECDVQERIFFIFGPPAMVNTMQNICLEVGCNEKMIKKEKFLGY